MQHKLTSEQAEHLLHAIEQEKYSGDPFEYIDITSLKHIIKDFTQDDTPANQRREAHLSKT